MALQPRGRDEVRGIREPEASGSPVEECLEDDEEEREGTYVFDPEKMEVRVMAEKCDTCIFHPGNKMMLAPGRVKGMVEEAARTQGYIPCHETTYHWIPGVQPAVCKGMAEHPLLGKISLVLRFGKALGILVEYVLPSAKKTAGQPEV